MSNYTDSDIEYQSRRHILMSAPWLDAPALREACKEALLLAMTTEEWTHCRSDFLVDVKEFCEDKRGRIPRVPRCLRLLDTVILTQFPESGLDQNARRSRDLIHMHLLQRDTWHMDRRGGDEG